VIVVFHGERLSGRYALFLAGRDPKDWLIHRMDPPEPGRAPMPERVAPMLARLGELPRDETGWGFEVKWDGVRTIAFGEPGRLRLQNRNLKDITERYPEVRGLREALGSRTAVLDGEVVAFDEDGRPSFERLQQRMHVASGARVRRLAASLPVVYVVFDLLYPRRGGPDAGALRGAARAAGVARAEGPGLARHRPTTRGRSGAARRHARAGPRGSRRQAPGRALRAGPAQLSLGQGEETSIARTS